MCFITEEKDEVPKKVGQSKNSVYGKKMKRPKTSKKSFKRETENIKPKKSSFNLSYCLSSNEYEKENDIKSKNYGYLFKIIVELTYNLKLFGEIIVIKNIESIVYNINKLKNINWENIKNSKQYEKAKSK